MENNILTNNLSTIKVKKIKIQNSEYPQSKLANSLTDFINSNHRFINKESSEMKTINAKRPIKSINSYFYVIPKRKIFEFKKIINPDKIKEINFRNKDYILPFLSNKNQSVKSNKENKGTTIDKIKVEKIKIKKQKDLIINPISLHLYTLTNEHRNKKIIFSKKNNKIKDEFLERIKDYRKRLKDQMIKRNKFQYSHSNNSFNNNKSMKKVKEPEKEKEKEKEIEENRFNYHQGNKYIFNMNENVDKALNHFYNKLKNQKLIFGKDKEITNSNSDKSLSNLSINQFKYNKINSFNMK